MPFVKDCCWQLILFGKETADELLHFCQVATASCTCPFGKDTVQGITFVKWLLQHAVFLLSRGLCFSFCQGSFARGSWHLLTFWQGFGLAFCQGLFVRTFWQGFFAWRSCCIPTFCQGFFQQTLLHLDCFFGCHCEPLLTREDPKSLLTRPDFKQKLEIQSCNNCTVWKYLDKRLNVNFGKSF